MEMPVYRVNAYYHAALRSHDVWTVKPFEKADDQLAVLEDFASLDIGEEEDDYS